MKRKLDENDAPTVEVSSGNPSAGEAGSGITFQTFNLDARILQAIAKSQFAIPTPIQAKTIPLALQGKDVFAKSKTGSGKTAAYALPILQGILERKKATESKTITALVLVPTRELSEQVTRVFSKLAEFCSKEVKALNITQRASDAVLNAKLLECPDIIVSTPGRLSQLLADGVIALTGIQYLVIDEADIILSYGYEDDITQLSKTLSKNAQIFLMSATLDAEVEQLKIIFAKDPVTVKIDDKEEKGEGVTQYMVKCGEEEKFLLIFVIFKLKLVKGKCIIFVADVDRSYRLKLYLEQYGIRSCVLNSELPVNSRLHVVEEFNKSMYDILIAADDQEVLGGVHRKARKSEVAGEDDIELSDVEEASIGQDSEKKPRTDYGVSRGIDFQNVSWVLNFDLPSSSKSYTHRIGRTARAGNSGMALSFVIPRTEFNKHKPTSHPASRNDEKVLAKITARQEKKGNEIKPYKFDKDQISAFRYRMNDALRAVTKVAVREARTREIKQELIRSEKLRKHFQDNPDDLKHLQRTDGGALGGGGVVRVQGHLKHVPDYLMPEKGRSDGPDVGFVSLNNPDGGNGSRKRARKGGFKKGGRNNKGKKNDPLKTFKTNKKK